MSPRAAIHVRAQPRQPGVDVDGSLGIGVGTGGVVDRERRFAGRRLQRDLAHRDLQTRVQGAAASIRLREAGK